MDKVNKVLVAFGAVFAAMLLGVFVVVMIWMSAHNTEVGLRNQFNAQQKSNESSFDKTWKVIQQQCGVATTERESFRKTYAEIMTATNGVAGNGQLASFFSQAKVDVSPALFSKLMTTIEAQRESFHRDQQHLAKMWQQHNDVLTKMPSSLFVGGRERLDLHLVTSAKTESVFAAGQDNDVELFKKE